MAPALDFSKTIGSVPALTSKKLKEGTRQFPSTTNVITKSTQPIHFSREVGLQTFIPIKVAKMQEWARPKSL